MLDIFKYLSWGLTTIVPFVGQWFFKFMEDDPDRPSKFRLTRIGRFAVVLTAVGTILSFGLTIISDRQSDSETAKVQGELDNSFAAILSLQTQNQAILSGIEKITASTTQPTTQPATATAKLQSVQTNLNNLRKLELTRTNAILPSGFAAYRERIEQRAKQSK